ncbi:MAG: hypothetical protein PWQ86_1904 [Bacillota bacterium]|nr:hypothetical protein [Bacillota bacterium]
MAYEMKLDRRMVQVELPFAVDLPRLTKALKEAGFYVRDEDGEGTSQGWGRGYDREGYYPYWVYQEGQAWFFAFPPEDYRQVAPGEAFEAYVGPEAENEFERWLPYLEGARLK